MAILGALLTLVAKRKGDSNPPRLDQTQFVRVIEQASSLRPTPVQ